MNLRKITLKLIESEFNLIVYYSVSIEHIISRKNIKSEKKHNFSFKNGKQICSTKSIHIKYAGLRNHRSSSFGSSRKIDFFFLKWQNIMKHRRYSTLVGIKLHKDIGIDTRILTGKVTNAATIIK